MRRAETKTATDDGRPTVGLSPDPSSSPSIGAIDNTEIVGVKGERTERQGSLDLPDAGIICVTVIQVGRPFMQSGLLTQRNRTHAGAKDINRKAGAADIGSGIGVCRYQPRSTGTVQRAGCARERTGAVTIGKNDAMLPY